jgi:hypothetical protein
MLRLKISITSIEYYEKLTVVAMTCNAACHIAAAEMLLWQRLNVKCEELRYDIKYFDCE